MLTGYIHKFKGDRKYFAIVFFILILIFLSGILTPVIVEKIENNWPVILSDKITGIQTSVSDLFKEKENNLLNSSAELKAHLHKILNPRNSTYGALIRLINSERFSGYSVEVLAPNGKLIAWSAKLAVPQNDILPLSFPAGQTHFYNSELTTYLTVTDTVISENDVFYLVVSMPFEKHYSLQSPYFSEINFTKRISDEFLTQFKVEYSPFAERTRDGRKYSFELLNNLGNKIALVTLFKPSMDTEIDYVYNTASAVQSMLVFLGVLFLAFGFRNDYKSLKYRSAKILIFAFYCAVFRMLLYYVGFPSNFMQGALVDPAYFSSAFGGGIVKSPIEFFVSAFFVLLISLYGFRYLTDYVRQSRSGRPVIFSLALLPAAFLFLLTLRGLGAAIKSIIFDSALRYFKEPNLIPNLPSMVMNINMLMLSVSVVLLLCAYILLLLSYLPETNGKRTKYIFIAVFILFQISGLLFIQVQREPLLTAVLNFIFILIIFLLAYHIYFAKPGNRFNYIYATLAASLISITLLNYFNLQLEKASLKTTALEINRPNDNLLRFLIRETLENASGNSDVITGFYDRNTNYDAETFLLWSNSSLQRESLNSSITVWDKNKKELGNFDVGLAAGKFPHQFLSYAGGEPQIIEFDNPDDTTKKIYTGIIQVTDRSIPLGYITVSVGFNIRYLGTNDIPDFLESKKNILNSVLNIRQLKIFEFKDSNLEQAYGDIYPSRDQIKPIVNAKFSQDNEAWLNLQLNGEDYFAYILKTNSENGSHITAVLTREKRISWDMFNFFKIFLIHSILIFLLFGFLLLPGLRKMKYSFRAQLLIAFLFVSIIPVIVLAVYNRQIVQQRSSAAIQNELNERCNYIENNLRDEVKETGGGNIITACQNAGHNLGIAFGVYDNSNLIFSSKEKYYTIGLFSEKLNPEAYYQLNYLSFREYLTKEVVEGFTYDSFYKKIIIDGRPLIISVSDAFNKVRLTFSVMDIDVFLFGIYSFATLIMILVSAFLASKISSPIRRLTKATDSVAHGDFNVQVDENVKGELKELLSGFNSMTRELQKNQAELGELERENAWKEMAKQVAHEIKNPLTPMKLAIQQLVVSYRDKNKNFDSIFEKVSATILNQIENLSVIASEFSRFARMPSYNVEELDLLAVIKDTANLFLEEKIKIEIKTELGYAAAEADKTQLRRLFINFIRNSIQAGAKSILVELIEEDVNYVVMIIDDGPGISDEIKEKIFESNFTTKAKGMGLGLKLAKRYLESINGDVSLVDGQGSGAAFKITIPRKPEKMKNGD